MVRKKGFTLIELLVVISIIAVLMAVLMPALGRAREQAKDVSCRSNQKQWGTMFQIFASENDGHFHDGYQVKSSNNDAPINEKLWLNAYRDYYGDKEAVRTCPSANKVKPNPNNNNLTSIGSSDIAWEFTWYGGRQNTELNAGSYALNGYVCYDEKMANGNPIKPKNYYWRTIDSSGASNIPMLTDSSYWKVYPLDSDAASYITDDFIWNNPSYVQTNYMASNAIDRHRGKINALFMDFSVRPVGLRGLWSLDWHKQWDDPTTGGRWAWGDWLSQFPE